MPKKAKAAKKAKKAKRAKKNEHMMPDMPMKKKKMPMKMQGGMGGY